MVSSKIVHLINRFGAEKCSSALCLEIHEQIYVYHSALYLQSALQWWKKQIEQTQFSIRIVPRCKVVAQDKTATTPLHSWLQIAINQSFQMRYITVLWFKGFQIYQPSLKVQWRLWSVRIWSTKEKGVVVLITYAKPFSSKAFCMKIGVCLICFFTTAVHCRYYLVEERLLFCL